MLYVGLERPSFTANIEEKTLQFRYSIRDIRDIDCWQMLSSSCLEENLIAVLSRLEDARGTIREIMTRIAKLPPKARADALEKLIILAGLRKLETIVKEEEKKMAISVNVMENAYLRELFLQGEQKGEQKGEHKREACYASFNAVLENWPTRPGRKSPTLISPPLRSGAFEFWMPSL